MGVLRVVLVLAAGASALGQFLQERHRLKTLSGLSGRRARDYYEATHARDERIMTGLTIALVVAAIAAVVVLSTRHAGGVPVT